jgi:hypothetical protein
MPFAYNTDRVPDEQTLVQWRHRRDVTRRACRGFRLPQLPRLRPAW